jgi:hypothetical protein
MNRHRGDDQGRLNRVIAIRGKSSLAALTISRLQTFLSRIIKLADPYVRMLASCRYDRSFGVVESEGGVKILARTTTKNVVSLNE